MTKRITFLCVVWMASLAFGEDSPPKAVAPKAPAGVAPTAPSFATPEAPTAPAFAPPEACKAPEPMTAVPFDFNTASGKSSPFSQFPAGCSMKFNVEGSFSLSFELGVDKDKAKHKTHKAKTHKAKKKATEKAES